MFFYNYILPHKLLLHKSWNERVSLALICLLIYWILYLALAFSSVFFSSTLGMLSYIIYGAMKSNNPKNGVLTYFGGGGGSERCHLKAW